MSNTEPVQAASGDHADAAPCSAPTSPEAASAAARVTVNPASPESADAIIESKELSTKSIAGGVDEDEQQQQHANEDATLDTRANRALLRKVDFLLMPPLLLLFGFQYADKAVLGSAAVAGLLKDLHLSVPSKVPGGAADVTRYSTATALFYAGYAVSVLPAAALIASSKIKNVVHFLGAMVILWGIIAILTPTVTDYRGLYAQRFFLGAVEATVSPGFVYITRSWYKRSEHASRLGIWYSATGVFSVFSGLINFGLSSIKQKHIAPWKILYIFAGAFTILFGLLFLLLVPKDPNTKPLLKIPGYNTFTEAQSFRLKQRLLEQDEEVRKIGASEKESKEAATAALASSAFSLESKEQHDTSAPAATTSSSTSESFRTELWESVLDIKLHIFFLIAFAIYLVNGAVTGFGSQIIKNIYHYSGADAIALQAPGGATTAISIYIVGYLSMKFRNSRIILLCVSCLPVLVGALMIWLGPWSNRGVVLAGLYLLPIFGAPFVMLLSLATANVQGRYKSSIATGYIFIGYALSNIAAPYTFRGPELKKKYRTTWITIIVAMCATIGLALLLGAKLYYDNRKKAAAYASSVQDKEQQEEQDTKQIKTDVKDIHFRYVF